ncbi:MAG: hemolysin III family protein, partial [Candidatus Magasanikiibacteriota bacterium]
KKTRIKKIFQRLDYSMIFVLIAGTYTPITLTMPQRVWGWTLFGIIWGLAIIGIMLKIFNIKIKEWLSVSIYLIMGWLLFIALNPLLQWLVPGAFKWLLVGGLFYTVGCVFFMLDKFVPRTKWFGMHEVFHLFVMAGSISHFWLMFKYILWI